MFLLSSGQNNSMSKGVEVEVVVGFGGTKEAVILEEELSGHVNVTADDGNL